MTWLAGGRLGSSADVGYVFLFFYGLERRVLVDAKIDAAARRRCRPSGVEGCGRSTATALFKLYKNLPRVRRGIGCLREGAVFGGPAAGDLKRRDAAAAASRTFGQCALDGRGAAAWALCWAWWNPTCPCRVWRGGAKRNSTGNFKRIYGQRFADGLKLEKWRTKLEVSYRAASGGLRSENFSSDCGGLPWCTTTVVTPLRKLQGVIDEAANGLDAYSRFDSGTPTRAESLETTLLLAKNCGAPRSKWQWAP